MCTYDSLDHILDYHIDSTQTRTSGKARLGKFVSYCVSKCTYDPLDHILDYHMDSTQTRTSAKARFGKFVSFLLCAESLHVNTGITS